MRFYRIADARHSPGSGEGARLLTRIPAGRWGVPDDLKGVAVFLASAASNYISGALIPVDGGFLGR